MKSRKNYEKIGLFYLAGYPVHYYCLAAVCCLYPVAKIQKQPLWKSLQIGIWQRLMWHITNLQKLMLQARLMQKEWKSMQVMSMIHC